jgi:hypothetical protein
MTVPAFSIGLLAPQTSSIVQAAIDAAAISMDRSDGALWQVPGPIPTGLEASLATLMHIGGAFTV